MSERIIKLETNEIYSKMKQFFLDRDYQILVDTPPDNLSIKQGSIWGILPRTAKKIINYRFYSKQSETEIRFSSSFAPEWKNLTIIGYIVSFFLVGLSFWISVDLEHYLITGTEGFWSWIATSINTSGFSSAQSFSELARILALFLILVLIVETFLVFYSRYKLNDVANEILNEF